MQLVLYWILFLNIVYLVFFYHYFSLQLIKTFWIPCKILLRSVMQKKFEKKNISIIVKILRIRLRIDYLKPICTYSTWGDLIYNAIKQLFFQVHLWLKGRAIKSFWLHILVNNFIFFIQAKICYRRWSTWLIKNLI